MLLVVQSSANLLWSPAASTHLPSTLSPSSISCPHPKNNPSLPPSPVLFAYCWWCCHCVRFGFWLIADMLLSLWTWAMSQRYGRSESYEHWKLSRSYQVRRALTTKADLCCPRTKCLPHIPFSSKSGDSFGSQGMLCVGNETFDLVAWEVPLNYNSMNRCKCRNNFGLERFCMSTLF